MLNPGIKESSTFMSRISASPNDFTGAGLYSWRGAGGWSGVVTVEIVSDVEFVEFVELVALEVLFEISIVTLPDVPLIVLFGSTTGTITGLGKGLYIDNLFSKFVK